MADPLMRPNVCPASVTPAAAYTIAVRRYYCDPDDLAAAAADLLGRPITLDDITEIADELQGALADRLNGIPLNPTGARL
jgi:hypothetical protein